MENIDEVLEIIEMEVGRAGSQIALAKEWEISQSYLSDVINRRRPPSPKLLSKVGMVLLAVPKFYLEKP